MVNIEQQITRLYLGSNQHTAFTDKPKQAVRGELKLVCQLVLLGSPQMQSIAYGSSEMWQLTVSAKRKKTSTVQTQ